MTEVAVNIEVFPVKNSSGTFLEILDLFIKPIVRLKFRTDMVTKNSVHETS